MKKFAVFAVLFGAVACSSSVMSSVDQSKHTNALMEPEKNQLCEDVYNYVRDNFSASDIAKIACGFDTSNDPATCHSAFDTCVASQPATLLGTAPDCVAFDASLAQCNTTVGQYLGCLKEELDALKALESQLPFCTLQVEQTAEANTFGKVSPACSALLMTCAVSLPGSQQSNTGAPDGG